VGPHTHGTSVEFTTALGTNISTLPEGAGGVGNAASPISVLSNGTSETRPKNVYVNFIIKI
jgi:hypothetical protein